MVAPALQRGRRVFVALLLLVGCLAAAVPFGDFRIPYHARIFVALMWAAGAAGIAAASWVESVRQRWQIPLLIAVAMLIRIVLLPMYPGDDFWRYAWEGRVQLAGFNPYLLAPTAPELGHLRDATWPLINHPETAAIYPPVLELVLAGITAISISPLAFKVTFTLADLATAWILWKLCANESRLKWTALYAWNPAVAYASAGGAHFDSLMVLAMMGAVLVLHRGAGSVNAWTSSVLIGLSVALKVVSGFLVPMWAWTLRRCWWCLFVIPLILILPALPYGGLDAVTRNLRGFADVTRFNDLVWWIPEMIFGPNPYQRNWPFTVVIALVSAVTFWRMREDWARASFWVLGIALILSPVLHPWYLVWILPLACWRGSIAWTVLSISVLAAFLLWETTLLWTEWQPNLLTRSMVILPPVLWLLWERSAKRAAS
jgi:hypothetical protein